jgi:HAD superfamily phosphoserine phosphatase-like hydrolase
MEAPKAVIFDIDGTLSPEVSWLSLTRDLGAPVERHIAIYQDYKAGNTDYETSKQALLRLWQSTGNANHDFFHTLFEQLPLDSAAADVVGLLRSHYELCIITGSMDMYAAIVAQKLDINTWFANTSLHWESNQLIDMDYELDQAAKKLEQFLGFCATRGYKPEDCIIVGDGENDLSLFTASGRGVLVGENLSDELRQHSWKVIPSLGELPNLLAA